MGIFDKITKHKDNVKTTNRQGKKLVNFYIDDDIWNEFKSKYNNASAKIRELITQSISPNEADGTEMVSRSKPLELLDIVTDVPALQIIGDIGIGKSTMVKRMIEADTKHVWIVIDSHNEYDGVPINSISKDITQNSILKLPKQTAGAKGVFSVYHNQILSEKLPEHFIIVIDEAHRYPEVKELLKESRKFVKIITITPEPLGMFCKVVKVIK